LMTTVGRSVLAHACIVATSAVTVTVVIA
jgi:hypothetical protein